MDKIGNLKEIILTTLDSNKALDIITIDLSGKSSIDIWKLNSVSGEKLEISSAKLPNKLDLKGSFPQ